MRLITTCTTLALLAAVGCTSAPKAPPLTPSEYMNRLLPDPALARATRVEPVGLRRDGRYVLLDIVVTAPDQECAVRIAHTVERRVRGRPGTYLRVATPDGSSVGFEPADRWLNPEPSPGHFIVYTPGYSVYHNWQRDSAGNVRVLVPVPVVMRVKRDAAYEIQLLRELEEGFTPSALDRCPVEIVSAPRRVQLREDVVTPVPIAVGPGTVPEP